MLGLLHCGISGKEVLLSTMKKKSPKWELIVELLFFDELTTSSNVRYSAFFFFILSFIILEADDDSIDVRFFRSSSVMMILQSCWRKNITFDPLCDLGLQWLNLSIHCIFVLCQACYMLSEKAFSAFQMMRIFLAEEDGGGQKYFVLGEWSYYCVLIWDWQE